MNFTPDQIRHALISVIVLVISVALHEFGHAYMADRLGDDTPRRQGRVTLNPIAHADLIGTIVLPLIGSFAGAGFGWGKPVQWQPHRVRRGISMATATILVAIAGPFMNLLLGTFVATVHVILVTKGVISHESELNLILMMAAGTNYVLFFFNLLPVPPLDGGHVAQSFMPYKYRAQYESIARYSPFALMAFVMIPQLTQVFVVPAQFCTLHVYELLGRIFGS